MFFRKLLLFRFTSSLVLSSYVDPLGSSLYFSYRSFNYNVCLLNLRFVGVSNNLYVGNYFCLRVSILYYHENYHERYRGSTFLFGYEFMFKCYLWNNLDECVNYVYEERLAAVEWYNMSYPKFYVIEFGLHFRTSICSQWVYVDFYVFFGGVVFLTSDFFGILLPGHYGWLITYYKECPEFVNILGVFHNSYINANFMYVSLFGNILPFVSCYNTNIYAFNKTICIKYVFDYDNVYKKYELFFNILSCFDSWHRLVFINKKKLLALQKKKKLRGKKFIKDFVRINV